MRDHSEGEKKGENYGVFPFSGDDVDCSLQEEPTYSDTYLATA
jgi:hypothetical protein